MVEEFAIRRRLTDCTANNRQGNQNEHAIITEVDQDAALRERLDTMGGGVVPGELRGFCRGLRIDVCEIKFMSLLL
jgi:hypothetical protein